MRHASLRIKWPKMLRHISAKRRYLLRWGPIQGLEAVHEPIECVGKLEDTLKPRRYTR